MRIGIGLPTAVDPDDGRIVTEWARAAEAAGFGAVAVIDRIQAPTYDPLTVLAAAGAVTSEIELMTSVVLAPLRPAAILASQAATVDRLSGGRLVLGLGVGSRPEDYDVVGVPYHKRGRILDEHLASMNRLWAGDCSIGPRPYRRGGPALLFGGYREPAFRRVAESGAGWICARGGANAFAEGARSVRAAWRAAGRAGRPRLISVVHYCLGSRAAATRDRFMRRYYGSKPFVQAMIDECATGPDELGAALQEHEAAGCDDVVLLPCAAELRQLDRLAELTA